MEVKLSEIFCHDPHSKWFTKSALLALDIKSDFVLRLAEYIGMTYLEREIIDNNLCYAQIPEIRSEYKQFFSRSDILHYLENCLKPRRYHMELDTITFPKSIIF